jgi:two-component system, OmpR family, sensor histidine kinase ArlS
LKVRNKILLYFSITVNVLTAISFVLIYLLFSEYRQEEFTQQQSERIKTTLQLLTDVKQDDDGIQETMDILTVYDYYDEKLFLFNSDKELLYVSKEDISDPDITAVLKNLSTDQQWYKTKEGIYDIVGIYTEIRGRGFFAISKAHDAFGYTKMFFLRNVLIGIFIVIATALILISQFLSNKISKPITALTNTLNNYDLGEERAEELQTESTTFEIVQLTDRFNDLLKRTREAFAFQKHTVHHISHQLKTPIAVLVSELERIKNTSSDEGIQQELHHQVIKAKSLGSIINVLLEISKIESGTEINRQEKRLDEVIFDVMDELNIIYPYYTFEVNFTPHEFDENRLIIPLNPVLISQVFQNLLTNCIAYSTDSRGEIIIDCYSPDMLKIRIANTGNPISKDESKLMFNHFFRGQNSQNKSGFGLGLVLTKKILELNNASIVYKNPTESLNIFELQFPLNT